MALSHKFKKGLVVSAISVIGLGFANTAMAQIVVTDPGNYAAVNAANSAAATTVSTSVSTAASNIVAAINTHDTNRGSFESNQTTTFYNDARDRLDKVINSLSHIDNNSRDSSLYAEINNQDTARQNVINLTDGNGTTFGVALPDGATSAMTDYLKRYTFALAADLYPTDLGLQNQVRDAQKALYYSEAMVGEVDAAREARFTVYQDLASKAENTEDVKQALEVNNALLVENGRNLALLIQLKTAELNAESAKLRQLLQERQNSSELFGVGGAGMP